MTVFLALSVAMSASRRGLTNVPNLFRLVAIAVGSTGLEADWRRATSDKQNPKITNPKS